MASLTILDVGHGNSAVLRGEKVCIIDAGRGSGLLDYLQEQGITDIETVLLSHADADHIGGLLGLLAQRDTFSLKEIYLNTDSSKDTAIWDDLLLELQKRPEIKLRVALTSAETEQLEMPDVTIEVLAPTPTLAAKGAGSTDSKGRELDSNSLSAVIRIGVDEGLSVLLAGDVDRVGLDNMLERNVDAKADILVFPHHGGHAKNVSMSQFAKDICEAVQPTTVIFSMSRPSKNPLPEIVQAIRQTNAEVRIACTQLSRHCAALLPSAAPTHHVAYSRGSEKNRCCAGSLVVDFERGQLLPAFAQHQQFITNNAPTALCISQTSVLAEID